MDQLSEALSAYTTRAAEKLRGEGLLVNVITVFVQTNRFKESPYSGSITLTLPVATDNTSELIGYALKGLNRIYQEGLPYKKAGVILSGLASATHQQTDLFDTKDRKKGKALMSVVDKINARMGKGTVSFASSGINQEWQMLSTLKSQRYTTNWNELLKVKA